MIILVKRLSNQEIFIILSAVSVLLFMYATIIFSAPINELTDMKEQTKENSVIDVNKTIYNLAYLNSSTEVDYE